MALDLEGWIKNDGLLNLPKALTIGQSVDVIHRDGDLFVGCLAGQPASCAEDFSIEYYYEDTDKGDLKADEHEGDILYFRPSSGSGECTRKDGHEILEALQ